MLTLFKKLSSAPVARVLGCILLLHLFSYSAIAQTEPTIAEIRIEGNRFVSEDKIRRVIRLQIGSPYEPQRVSEALKRLYATKEFSDVRAYQRVQGTRVILTIVVKEHIRIDEVKFEGNDHIDDKDLNEKMLARAGTFIRPSVVRKDFAVIEEMYKEKGYYRVQVKDEIKTEEDKKKGKRVVRLYYKIDEGDKVKIRHIDFFGNRSVDSEVIRKVMESDEDGWLSGGEFKPRVLERDVVAIDSL